MFFFEAHGGFSASAVRGEAIRFAKAAGFFLRGTALGEVLRESLALLVEVVTRLLEFFAKRRMHRVYAFDEAGSFGC